MDEEMHMLISCYFVHWCMDTSHCELLVVSSEFWYVVRRRCR